MLIPGCINIFLQLFYIIPGVYGLDEIQSKTIYISGTSLKLTEYFTLLYFERSKERRKEKPPAGDKLQEILRIGGNLSQAGCFISQHEIIDPEVNFKQLLILQNVLDSTGLNIEAVR
ncbi:MAG TPA: hypothetical protein PKA90_05580 [Ignavibacteria bacterium]|nr:hypothetical protein [Ignavibacteria bacterium]HMR39883.1 hypothetical protein [Ignavibacteria bacterium]